MTHLADWIDRNEADWARGQTDETLQFYARNYRQLAKELTADSREIAVHRYRVFERELRWRQAPKLNPDREREIADRKARVKQAWPIDRYCTQLLGCEFTRFGDRLKCACPLPGHRGEKTASFTIFTDDDHFHCFGCKQHGDIIDLTRMVLGIDGFMDIIIRLEEEGGLAA